MEKIFNKIIYSNNIFLKPLNYFLFLLSLIYKIIIVYKRKKGYRKKIGKSFIISVGNLTTGGTGKTPFVIYLANKICKKYSLCIILRGYKGNYKEKALQVEKKYFDKFNITGDEPLLFLKNANVPVIIARKRKDGIIYAEKKYKPDIIILDDAFQHFEIKRDINIVLIDYFNPFGNNKLIPAGILREPLTALKDADIIIITKFEKEYKSKYSIQELKNIVRKYNRKALIFLSNFLPEKKFKKNKKILSFAGIGNFSYFKFLIEKYLKPKEHLSLQYPDHHIYSKKDIQKLKRLKKFFDKVITTEKDYIKLNKKWISIFKIKFNLFEERKFLDYIKNAYEKN